VSVELKLILTPEVEHGRTLIAGHKCGGYSIDTDYGKEFDCEYGAGNMFCEECVFVVGHETGDYRKGKRPWAKRWQS